MIDIITLVYTTEKLGTDPFRKGSEPQTIRIMLFLDD